MTRRDWLREAGVGLVVPGLFVGTLNEGERMPPRNIALPQPAWVDHDVTWYCPCDWCCGVWAADRSVLVAPATGLTSLGHKPIEGCTVAVDPKVWAYGTLLEIEGLGVRIASDCGGDVKGRRLDVFVEDHEHARRRGRRTLRVRKFVPRRK